MDRHKKKRKSVSAAESSLFTFYPSSQRKQIQKILNLKIPQYQKKKKS